MTAQLERPAVARLPVGSLAAAVRGGRWTPQVAGTVLAVAVLLLLLPFLHSDPPLGLTGSNAPFTDEGFNLANARERVLFGRFATGDIDRSLTNGAFSGAAALLFAATDPLLVVGRVLSVVAVAAAVWLLAVGLAEPLGRRVALLAGVALAGSDLLLEYGRLAMVESLLVLLLVAAFVVAVRGAPRPGPGAGAATGLLLAAAISVKATALLPALAIIGVALWSGWRRRDRAAFGMGVAMAAGLALAALAWVLAVALPNRERLLTALAVWPDVDYTLSPWGLAGRFGGYLADSDQALLRALPVLLAAVGGAALLLRRRGGSRDAPPRPQRDALAMAALWGFGLWLAIAAGDYAPNRYVVPALPGLAVLAGYGADRLLDAARRRDHRVAPLVAVVLVAALALPGVTAFVATVGGAERQRERIQGALAKLLPEATTIYGTYGPTLLFDTGHRLVTPWPPADANMRDPVGRFGVTHLLVGGPDDPTNQVPAFEDRRGFVLVTQVTWGDEEISLYRLPKPRPVPVDPEEDGEQLVSGRQPAGTPGDSVASRRGGSPAGSRTRGGS